MQKIARILMIPLFLLTVAFVQGQTRTITGKVLGNNNEPISGASVSVKGSSAGTSAGQDGSFKIDVRGAATLIVTSIGFNTVEVPVAADQNSVSVSLNPAEGMNQQEIVVTSFGMTRQRRALGYSVTQVGGDRFTESRTANIGNALSGKVAGPELKLITRDMKKSL